ncbi:hypothetical protein SODALDRAFT_355023 [Sodiomyces alkalinus F11]|uniref:Uncharacterized protein n=1 Tax=Sodiomyces alkalinus (strain CBS 110278 / VKM F-3762 / F11) TaxID=1314773 RepID=A0A3N2Q7S9_SODAK|nr:hypothetical protein SODALDRAFT_355023 [Sodiomyces alkalinus F11]ROT42833.1 hypothetical protein SODALDRAFT_355023 [Sodiomyces alkalinus F11]
MTAKKAHPDGFPKTPFSTTLGSFFGITQASPPITSLSPSPFCPSGAGGSKTALVAVGNPKEMGRDAADALRTCMMPEIAFQRVYGRIEDQLVRTL